MLIVWYELDEASWISILISFRLSLILLVVPVYKIFKHLLHVNTLMPTASLMRLAVLVLVTGGIIGENRLIEDSSAGTVQAFFWLLAYSRCWLALCLVVEPYLTIAWTSTTLVVKFLVASIRKVPTNFYAASICKTACLKLRCAPQLR